MLYSSEKDFALKMSELFRASGIIEVPEFGYRRDPDKLKEKEMDRFLNRVLLLPVKPQNDLLDFFNQIQDELIEVAKFNGEYDRGVQNLNKAFCGIDYHVEIINKEVLWEDPHSGKYKD